MSVWERFIRPLFWLLSVFAFAAAMLFHQRDVILGFASVLVTLTVEWMSSRQMTEVGQTGVSVTLESTRRTIEAVKLEAEGVSARVDTVIASLESRIGNARADLRSLSDPDALSALDNLSSRVQTINRQIADLRKQLTVSDAIKGGLAIAGHFMSSVQAKSQVQEEAQTARNLTGEVEDRSQSTQNESRHYSDNAAVSASEIRRRLTRIEDHLSSSKMRTRRWRDKRQ